MIDADVLIIGGGLAGLTAAIHLSQIGYSVTLLEKESYPLHKVCGEFVSNEIRDYLKWLDVDIEVLSPSEISHLHFAAASGKYVTAKLHMGGFGISRFKFDEFLYHKAIANGVSVVQDTVTKLSSGANYSIAETSGGKAFQAKIILGAYGKRSSLDVSLSRDFIKNKSEWLAVKCHYHGPHDERLVGLYSFDGGYCGVSKVEDGIVNVCYLVRYSSFKKFKNIDEHRLKVLCRNPVLKQVFAQLTPIYEKPLTIGQISFDKKNAVEDGVIMIGDTAGLIHPLCGNGMAMAITSAGVAASLVSRYLQGNLNRAEMENQYQQEWNAHFSKRTNTGKMLNRLLQYKKLTNVCMSLVATFPVLLRWLIRQTHGQSFNILDYNAEIKIPERAS